MDQDVTQTIYDDNTSESTTLSLGRLCIQSTNFTAAKAKLWSFASISYPRLEEMFGVEIGKAVSVSYEATIGTTREGCKVILTEATPLEGHGLKRGLLGGRALQRSSMRSKKRSTVQFPLDGSQSPAHNILQGVLLTT